MLNETVEGEEIVNGSRIELETKKIDSTSRCNGLLHFCGLLIKTLKIGKDQPTHHAKFPLPENPCMTNILVYDLT